MREFDKRIDLETSIFRLLRKHGLDKLEAHALSIEIYKNIIKPLIEQERSHWESLILSNYPPDKH